MHNIRHQIKRPKIVAIGKKLSYLSTLALQNLKACFSIGSSKKSKDAKKQFGCNITRGHFSCGKIIHVEIFVYLWKLKLERGKNQNALEIFEEHLEAHNPEKNV